MLERFGMTAAKNRIGSIPAADYKSIRPDETQDKRIDITEYQQGIGSLIFAMTLTKPDTAFILG